MLRTCGIGEIGGFASGVFHLCFRTTNGWVASSVRVTISNCAGHRIKEFVESLIQLIGPTGVLPGDF